VTYIEGRITVSNNVQPKYTSEPGTGLGLENLAERYRILTGEEIDIHNDGRTFSVSINTVPNENNNNRR
jgi:hypothetical protein